MGYNKKKLKMTDIWKANRIADENIYINENRYKKPKEVHKRIINLIERFIDEDHKSILDCATATGELIFFLNRIYPDKKFFGFDISENMISKAKEKVPNAKFFVQDIQKSYADWLIKPKSSIVIASGILCIFDDYKSVLDNILSCASNNGIIIIRTIINPDPIDVVMRYRRSNNTVWESGWNILSKETLENYLKEKDFINSFEWDDYKLPIKMEKKISDPMRAHTKLIDGENILVNGACQILNQTNLIIKIK